MKFQRLSSQPDGTILQRDSLVGCSLAPTNKGTFRSGAVTSVVAAIATLGKVCLKALVGSSNPVVTQMKSIEGDRFPLYSIYDPVTQQRVAGLSEAEVRTWLEQRYYR